jgi:hypothetical protein
VEKEAIEEAVQASVELEQRNARGDVDGLQAVSQTQGRTCARDEVRNGLGTVISDDVTGG